MIHPNCSLQLPPHPEEATVGGGGGGDGGTGNTTNSIGLSMIKTWLRNQPPHSAENNNNNESGSGSGGAPRVQQTLSLSMSTGSQSSSSLPLLTANNVSAGESSSSENKKPPPPPATAAALDSNQTGGAIVDSSNVPRKAIDTFGQRTSIYRGVTRFPLLFFFFNHDIGANNLPASPMINLHLRIWLATMTSFLTTTFFLPIQDSNQDLI